MANRNDDIKQLFSHLGLNEEDYRELRRQGGGTEAERVTRSAPSSGGSAPKEDGASSPTGSHASSASRARSGSRFNAQSQPRVYLPGLTPENPQEEPPPVRVEAPAASESSEAPPSVLGPQSAATRRWPLLEAAAERPARPARIVPPPVSDLPETRHFSSTTPASSAVVDPLAAMPKASEAVRSAAMSLGERLRSALLPRNLSEPPERRAVPVAEPAPVPVTSGAQPTQKVGSARVATSLGSGALPEVLKRLREVRAKSATDQSLRRLQYPGRSLTAVVDSPNAQDALNDVFHRINRPRR